MMVRPGPGKITLDQESFKALASEVRVGILKTLDERRQTVKDLSKLIGLSKRTLLEHLEKLQSAGLVKRLDEGRKWIYYELSDKGRKILHPERVSIVVALSSAAVLVAIGLFFLASTSGLLTGPAFAGEDRTGAAQGIAAAGGFVPWASVVAFVLAAVAVVAAVVLRTAGIRRRKRLFDELAHA